MFGNALEHVAQIRLRVDTAELGRTDQAVQRGSMSAPGVGAGVQPVFPPQSDRSYFALGSLVVDLDSAIAGIAREGCSSAVRVQDGARQARLDRRGGQRRVHPQLEVCQPRQRLLLPYPASFIGRPATDGLLDRIQLPDASQRLCWHIDELGRRTEKGIKPTDCSGEHEVMARQVRPWLAKPDISGAHKVVMADRSANQQIPSGTATALPSDMDGQTHSIFTTQRD